MPRGWRARTACCAFAISPPWCWLSSLGFSCSPALVSVGLSLSRTPVALVAGPCPLPAQTTTTCRTAAAQVTSLGSALVSTGEYRGNKKNYNVYWF